MDKLGIYIETCREHYSSSVKCRSAEETSAYFKEHLINLNYYATKKRVNFEKAEDYIYYSIEWFASDTLIHDQTSWRLTNLRINEVLLEDSTIDPFE